MLGTVGYYLYAQLSNAYRMANKQAQ